MANIEDKMMKEEQGLKTRDVLIIVGILVAILIGLSTRWAVAGEAILGSIF